MKKNMFLICIIAIVIVIFGVFVYYKNDYSLEKTKALLLEGDKLSENISIVQNFFDENNELIAYIDFFKKDDMTYILQNDNTHKYAETVSNGSESYMISHDTKTIFHENSNKEKIVMSESFFNKLNQNTIYKYCGKTKVDNIYCIKVSLCVENTNNTELTYYYIDLENKHIIKEENYVGSSIKELSLKNSITYQYTYNSVKDTDILQFDKANYPDYTYNEL